MPLTATERGTSNEKTGRRTLVPFVSRIRIAQPRIKSRNFFRGGEREEQSKTTVTKYQNGRITITATTTTDIVVT